MPFEFNTVYYDRSPVSGRALDIFTPVSPTRETALFFVHGGGWRAGSRSIYHRIIHAFNDLGFICASADYRLAGVSLPEQITDVRHGYDLFIHKLASLGRKPRVAVCGSSAGAHLAALMALAAPSELGEDLSSNDYSLSSDWRVPAGVVLQAFTPFFTPWVDIFPGIWSSMQDIAGKAYDADPGRYVRFSPIEHVGNATPPVFIAHAENEHMFPYENLLLFKEKMEKHRRTCVIKTYTRAEHGFFYDVTRRQQKEFFADMLEFIDTTRSG